jgi:DNA-binding PucR family transcriptional regulator
MSDQPKVQQNFNAPVTSVAGNVEGDMIIHAPEPKITAAAQQLAHLLSKLRSQSPNATDEQIFDRLVKGFEAMPQKNPKNWQRWQDIFSVVFAGGVEATKIIVPVAGIPIEITKRLYEVYQHHQKQLPGN